MLDKNTLSQLKQLKKDITDSREFAEGTVKATQRRFGFVVLDDGREVFLAPEEMDKVFAGDLVKIEVITDPKDQKISGLLQKVIKSAHKQFCGRYVIKGKGHFVEPDVEGFSRWIFIPPNARQNAKDGDLVFCQVSRHPYPSGKPQAKVVTLLGDLSKAGVEGQYMAHKHGLERYWPKNWEDSLNKEPSTDREDLTAIDFFTIDSPSTQDMDDALSIEKTAAGWQLTVAIADPSELIPVDSPLDKEAKQRTTTTYMPGYVIPMLPEELSQQRCSLCQDADRLALVCTLQINNDGGIASFGFKEATIRSKAKLNYYEVSKAIDGQDCDEQTQQFNEQIQLLNDVSKALNTYRTENFLLVPNRPEYRLQLNEHRKIESIEQMERNSAQEVVEECMIAANICAAKFLGNDGVFISHAGFRPERIEGVNKLADENLSMKGEDFSSLEGYKKLIKSIKDDELEFPLRSVLSRSLERALFSNEAKPHFGMGLESYTTFTSPIRKYSDLLVHRFIKAKLRQAPLPKIEDRDLEIMLDAQDRSRLARNQMEYWLKVQYLEPKLNEVHEGEITQLNSFGFTVRLDNGVEGFVEAKQLPEHHSFDPLRLRLNGASGGSFQLEQRVTVQIKTVDVQKRFMRFELPSGEAA